MNGDQSKYLHSPLVELPNKYPAPHFSFSITPMAFSAISPLPLAVSLGFHRLHCPTTVGRRFSYPCASLSSSSSESKSAKASSPSDGVSSSNGTSTPLVEPSRAADSNFSYAYANPSGGGGAFHPIIRFMGSAESSIERVLASLSLSLFLSLFFNWIFMFFPCRS